MPRPLHSLLFGLASFLLLFAARAEQPNVLLIITDDQGYGDLGLHGNKQIQTPNLDRLGSQSVQLTQFLVNPVCSPTRASVLTGRYYYRTGVVDTFMGRSLMWTDETTLPEVLGDAGYRTGLFGKWHLGDNYPMRALDQGFQEVLICRGGGLAQPSDEPGTVRDRAYFDPVLQHNGESEKYKGYCTDIFTTAAIQFIEENREQPFFAMLATNAPHDPLQVPEADLKPYLDAGLPEKVARVYAMVTNVDRNMGRLLTRLEELELDQKTIVIFMSDNGPYGERYNAGMRGQKGTVYEGGIRVPCFVRWNGTLKPAKVDRMAAHIDLMPTLLEACAIPVPDHVKMDGRSLLGLLRGDEKTAANWPDRTLHFQWHRGNTPQLFRQSAARTQRWKLVNGKELYDLANDPAESTDVATANPDVVKRLREEHEAWFSDVTKRCSTNPSRIVIGSDEENPSLLTRQDIRTQDEVPKGKLVGEWLVNVAEPGRYRATVINNNPQTGTEVHVKFAGKEEKLVLDSLGTGSVEFEKIPKGDASISAAVSINGKAAGADYLKVERLESN